MPNKLPFAIRVFNYAERTVATIGLFGMVYFLLWAILIFLMQCMGWLQSATWQQVPLGVMFISQSGQDWFTQFSGKMQPLNLVPALGSADSVVDLAGNLAGRFDGVKHIVNFVLNTPLVIWLLVACGLSLSLSLATFESVKPK